MEAFKQHTGLVGPVDRVNVDTDAIIPKQFLKRIERSGFGQFLFYEWRFDEQGAVIPEFSLNLPRYQALRYCFPAPTSAAALPVSMRHGRFRTMVLKSSSHRRLPTFSTITALRTAFCRSS